MVQGIGSRTFTRMHGGIVLIPWAPQAAYSAMDNDQYLCDIPVHQQLQATSRTIWLLYSSNIQKTLKIGIINFGCQPMPILFWRSGENDFDKKLCYFKYAVIFQLSIHLLFSISCLCLTQQGRYLTILFRIQLCSYLKLFDVWSLWFFLRLN